MLQLITGRSGFGKTTRLYRLLREAAENTAAPLYLIVPEQASFENERRLLTEFGPVLSQRVQVLSFTRMAQTVFREVGGLCGKRMDNTLSLLLMNQALHSVADSLSVYRCHVDNPDYLRSVLDFLTECKQCTVTPQQLEETAATLPVGILRSKLQETALIFGAYEALAASAALIDPQDDLTVLADRLPSCTLFDGAQVYLDSFKGFTEQELRVLDRLLPRVASLTVALCTDTVSVGRDSLGRFSSVARTASALRDMAARHRVPVASPISLTENLRTDDPALRALEAGCYAPAAPSYDGPADSVCITPFADRAAECRYAARTIRRLLRENGGYCRDFTVVARNSSDYEELLASALRREGLPYTVDLRESVLTQPLITLLESALAAIERWDSADILRLVKTGLVGFSAASASLLENYAFVWNIRGKAWRSPFTAHPDGLDARPSDKADRQLAYLNILRHRLAEPLSRLQSRLSGNRTGREFAAALWSFLQELRVPRMVRLQVARLKAAGEQHLAEQQARMWDYTVSLLDKFASLTVPTTCRRFADLLHLAVSTDDLGSIPPTLDGVQFGAADRIRYTSPKTVLILGANEGVFPAYPSTGGLLADRGRRLLIEAGLPMADDADHRTAEERYFAYTAVAAPSERLIVTYLQNETAQPSSLIDTIKAILPKAVQGRADDAVSESAEDAFHRLSAVWYEPTIEASSLRAVLADHPAYTDRLNALQRAERGLALQNEQTARRLFGENLYLSPSQVDVYHNCRFSYFCDYGLRLKPRVRAELNPAQAGTLAHYIMSELLPDYTKRQYEGCTKSAIHKDVSAAVERYIAAHMGDMDTEDAHLRALFTQLTRFCDELMWRVIRELQSSRFVPVDYELPIGKTDENGNGIPPWILTAPDGTTVQVRGTVDRVDVYRDGDTSYIRIVDYKTGNKVFSLAEVLEGLNLQMLIYLFSLCQNGAERYGTVSPAGVLYLPAKLPVVQISREVPEDELERQRLAVMRMNGLLIDNPEILRAMEADLAGVFIPVGTLKSGELSKTSSLASLEQFGYIQRRIEDLLSDMAVQLHRGAIDAIPVGGTQDGCRYCQYHEVCCHEDTDPIRELTSRSLSEALEDLRTAYGEEDAHGLDD